MYTLVIGRAFPSESTGMMGIFEFEQAVALKKSGIKTVYAFCDNRSIKLLRKFNYESFEKENVPVYGYHLPIGGLPQAIFNFIKANRTINLIKKVIEVHGSPEVIHIHFPLLNLNNQILDYLKNLKVRIVVTEHWSKIQNGRIEDFRIELLNRIVKEADSFICVGELLRQSIYKLTNTKKEIRVIPNMLNDNFYYEPNTKSNNSFHFITIGRLVEAKRFKLVVQAFAEAFTNEGNVHLDIVGDGPLYNEIKQEITKNGLQHKIIMHGFLSRKETANLLRKSDVFVSASVLETFGVPFIEAMACGKPVIGIKNGPIDRYINKNNGLLFDADNKEELKMILISIYQNYTYYNNKEISNVAKDIFSENSIVNSLKKIYYD